MKSLSSNLFSSSTSTKLVQQKSYNSWSMNSSNSSNDSSEPTVDFDRRTLSVEAPCFPLIDSNGETVEKERRLDASTHLSKIDIRESLLTEDEFVKLFKQ
jgi:hypothetical protein